MKKFNIFFTLVVLVLLAFSCKRKDQTPPKIFITGDSLQRVVVGTWYEDEGATADDNFDGAEISSKISITYDISGLPSGITDWKNLEGKTNKTGSYVVTYSVTDEAGFTTSKDRKVDVYNMADKFAVGYYTNKIASNQQGGTIPDYTGVTMNVTSDTKVNNRILFPKISGISGLKIYGDIRDSIESIIGTDTIYKKYIDIPVQTKTLTVGSNTYDYTITGVPNESYFPEPNDTLFFYKFKISYTIDRLDGSGNLYNGNAVEVYTKI